LFFFLDVVQHVLANGNVNHRSRIVAAVRGSLVLMSTHKFASNVIEKCFLYGSEVDRLVYIFSYQEGNIFYFLTFVCLFDSALT
jgi:hypothetical protein